MLGQVAQQASTFGWHSPEERFRQRAFGPIAPGDARPSLRGQSVDDGFGGQRLRGSGVRLAGVREPLPAEKLSGRGGPEGKGARA